MYYLLALFLGFCCAFMLVQNGSLSDGYGVYLSTALIHVVGLVSVGVLQLFRRQSLKPRNRLPFYFFLGGVFGFVPTVFNNAAFGIISVTAILALGLLGQSLTSILFDHFGLLGVAKQPFHWQKLIGIAFVVAGIALMLMLGTGEALAGAGGGVVLAIVMSVLAGACLVITRTLNGRLSRETSGLASTTWNYITGLTSSLLVLAVVRPLGLDPAQGAAVPWWAWLGGTMGVFVVFMLNVVVQKVSSFYTTLLLFVGQIFTAVVLDKLLAGTFSIGSLVGGIAVAVGLSMNVFIDARCAPKQNANAREDQNGPGQL